MSNTTRLLPFQPMSMNTAQLAAVSFLARYAGHTHELYSYQLRRWFQWCETNGLDPLVGIQRAHVELYIRSLGEAGLMGSSTNTMMHGVRGFFRFAHIDGLIPADPPSTPDSRRFIATSPEPRGWTDSSSSASFRSPRPSPSTTAPWPTCWVSTPSGPQKLPQSRSRTTPRR
jgi:hypothetical protein